MLAQLELRQHCEQLQIAVQVCTHLALLLQALCALLLCTLYALLLCTLCELLLRLQGMCAGVFVTRQSRRPSTATEPPSSTCSCREEEMHVCSSAASVVEFVPFAVV